MAANGTPKMAADGTSKMAALLRPLHMAGSRKAAQGAQLGKQSLKERSSNRLQRSSKPPQVLHTVFGFDMPMVGNVLSLCCRLNAA